jgi:endonuclease-3
MTAAVSSKSNGAKGKRVQAIKIPDAIRLMTERYGPFEEEPRLDPAHEAVFTILSQHTSDINSSRAFRFLMDRFGSLEAVARGDEAKIEEAISPGGLAKVKAPRIKLFLNRVLELNGSLDLSFLREMPLVEAKAWLRQLPGIGPKSAGIILNFSLGMPAMAIDTHIYRVCQRLRFIGPKVTVDKAHEIMEAKVPPEQVFQFHIAIINHGRRVCKAQRPLCAECVVAEGCPSRSKIMKSASKKPASAKTNGRTGRAKTDGPIMPHVPVGQAAAEQAADPDLKDPRQ